jgi:hypothetical protein
MAMYSILNIINFIALDMSQNPSGIQEHVKGGGGLPQTGSLTHGDGERRAYLERMPQLALENEDMRSFFEHRHHIAIHSSIKGILMMGTFRIVQEMAVRVERLQDNRNALQRESANAKWKQRNFTGQVDRRASLPPLASLPRTVRIQ